MRNTAILKVSCAAAALLAWTAGIAHATENEACRKSDGQAGIDACTAVISADRLAGRDLATVYLERGFKLSTMGRLEPAIADYSEAIRIDPSYALAFNNRCALHNRTRNYDRALEDCAQAIRLDSGLANAYLGRGNAYRSKGEYAAAIRDYDVVITLNPNLTSAYFGRGAANYRTGEYDGKELWDDMRIDDVLMLVREADNPHDANAVRVEWRGHRLGYVPRRENRTVAQHMDRGGRVEARISKLQKHPNAWQRIEFEIFVRL